MKNAILFYYQIPCENIVQKKNQYHFQSQSESYCLFPTTFSNDYLNLIGKLVFLLKQNHCPTHEMILNRNGEWITIIHQIPYVLLKLVTYSKEVLTLSSLLWYQNQTKYLLPMKELQRNDWFSMWSEKIDYLEEQWKEFGKKYPILFESFFYYVGMAENAISLFQEYDFQKLPIILSRRRVSSSDTLTDFYNPILFIFDFKAREIAEYFKSKFYSDPYVYEEILFYLSTIPKEEWILFFIRMLFPTHYFDCMEDILLEEKKETDLLFLLDKQKDYELLLKKLYSFLKSKVVLTEIKWLLLS